MNNPLVTVCIPTYNHGIYLEQALDSVLCQTYSNLEIIIVDNYSTDNTDEVLVKFDDSRIKIYKNNNYGSIAVSRNLAVNKSSGEWVAFLDSDDWWNSNKIEICSKYFNSKYDFIYHSMKVFSQNSQSHLRRNIGSKRLRKPIFRSLMIKGNPIACSSVVIRRSLFQEINGMDESPKLAGIEDYNAWLKASLITNRFRRIKKNLASYRLHDGNFIRTESSSVFPYIDAVEEFLPLLSTKQVRKLNSNNRYYLARSNFLNGNQFEKDLSFILKYSSFEYRVKALWMFFARYTAGLDK
jgi:glycosyltransferase involved in cell wall biosynthesis